MPTPGKRWRHLTISTHCAWLPGDKRGWRSRHHKKHSSGDHRNPPPPGEHAGLHRHSQSISGQPVFIPKHLRGEIGRRFRDYLEKLGHRVLVISVSGMHVHALVELPAGRIEARKEVGKCKQSVSLMIGSRIKGKVWQKDCGLKLIRDEEHHRHTYQYIRDHVKEGAWVWTYREGEIGAL